METLRQRLRTVSTYNQELEQKLTTAETQLQELQDKFDRQGNDMVKDRRDKEKMETELQTTYEELKLRLVELQVFDWLGFLGKAV